MLFESVSIGSGEQFQTRKEFDEWNKQITEEGCQDPKCLKRTTWKIVRACQPWSAWFYMGAALAVIIQIITILLICFVFFYGLLYWYLIPLTNYLEVSRGYTKEDAHFWTCISIVILTPVFYHVVRYELYFNPCFYIFKRIMTWLLQ